MKINVTPNIDNARKADGRLRDWARWVRVRPWREAQEAMFAMIDRQPGRPTKDAVIAQIRAMDQGGVA